jgi:hypothetical protein
MNKSSRTDAVARGWAILALALMQGCASKTAEPSPKVNVPQTASSVTGERVRLSEEEVLREAAAKPSAALEGEGWQALFDGKTLAGWRETDFAGRGELECTNGLLVLRMGDPFTGVNLTNDFPKMNYEVALDAMRVSGSDFFCGLTVPVSNSFCSLIVGGWGGSLIGISSLDGMDASENETTKFMNFEQGRWYRIRLRITEGRIEGWIDQEKLINVVTTDRRISLRPGDIEYSKPFGFASYQTTAALRGIKVRKISTPAGPAKKF